MVLRCVCTKQYKKDLYSYTTHLFIGLTVNLNFIVGGYVASCSLLKVYSIFLKVLFSEKPVENGKLNRPLKTRTCHRITEWFVRRPRGAMKRDLSSSLALGLQLFITSIWMMKNKTKQNKMNNYCIRRFSVVFISYQTLWK